MEPVWLYDTTLRDGTQGEDINFTAEEKIRIAMRLDDIGIHYIEGGWPGSNPRDDAFFDLASRVKFKKARLVAFGSTRRAGVRPSADANLNALVKANTPAVAMFGKTWDLHVEQVMDNTLAENLAMIRESVEYVKSQGREVLYDAEHFFDGYKGNREYAEKTIAAALDGGADSIVLCDTNGGSLPTEITAIVTEIWAFIQKHRKKNGGQPVTLGIHTHNDSNLAVANTITAVDCGATVVQGTVNGYGERCGNADLTSIIPVLQLKMNRPCLTDENLARLRELSRYVSEAANMTPVSNRPFVGESAFAHKGGIHVSAIMKCPAAYEHMNPELVGNRRRVLVSDLAGKSNVAYKARELGIEIEGNGTDTAALVSEVKRMENQGYQFDAAEGSFEIWLKKKLGQYEPAFELLSFLVTIRKEKDRQCYAEATIKLLVDGQERFTAAEGDGPVGALDNALRRALHKFYPEECDNMRLVDFKVRVIDGREGTAARVKVFIESRDKKEIWRTIGVSEDIIEASWQALADSFQYRLNKAREEHNHS